MSRLSGSLRGAVRLATDATVEATDLVEAMHAEIGWARRARGGGRRGGIAGFVYRTIRRVARLVGRGAEAALVPEAVSRRLETASPPARAGLVAALNGVCGDRLAATRNPLAIEMSFRRDGQSLTLTPPALASAFPGASPHVVVLAHGLCMNDLQWAHGGHSHGAALERDLGATAVYLHYNTGLHISTNGRAFADGLERLVAAWPVPVASLSIVGHSMGGLVARSAGHYAAEAGHAWPRRLRRLVFLGTPHHGSPVERLGNGVDTLLPKTRYTAPLARLGQIRSAGVTDLRYSSLLDEDWQGRNRFARAPDARRPVPLPDGVACFSLAATMGRRPGSVGDRLLHDGFVPRDSAAGRHPDAGRALAFSADRQHVVYGRHHFDLLGAEVYPVIQRWMRA